MIKIRKDYGLHALVSAALYLALCVFTTNVILSFITVFTIGIAKEIYDEKFRTGFSFGDIIADLVGIIIGAFLYAALFL